MVDLNSPTQALRLVSSGIVDKSSHLLPEAERSAFVQACTEAGTDDERFQSILRRYFCTWKTSLMGNDLTRLQRLANYPQIQGYVKVICLEDDSDDSGKTSPSESDIIWPRHEDGQVATEGLGIGLLKAMLATQELRPDRLEIRDKRNPDAPSDPEVAAILAHNILDSTDLAVTAFILEKKSPMTTLIAAELSAEHQGQGIGFTILRKAEICLSQNFNSNSYWTNQILFHAPALKELSISFWKPLQTYRTPPFMLDSKAWPALEKLEIFLACLTAPCVMAILSNSNQTLTGISFRIVELGSHPSWSELLSRIGNEFPHLSWFKLNNLSEGPVSEFRISFLALENEGVVSEAYKVGLKMLKKGSVENQRIARVEYEGPDASHVLGIAAECAVAAPLSPL